MFLFKTKEDKITEAAFELALKNLSCNSCPFLEECSSDFTVSCSDMYRMKAREGVYSTASEDRKYITMYHKKKF